MRTLQRSGCLALLLVLLCGAVSAALALPTPTKPIAVTPAPRRAIVPNPAARVNAQTAAARAASYPADSLPFSLGAFAASADQNTLWLVSSGRVGTSMGQLLVRYDRSLRRETQRVDLGAYTHTVSSMVPDPLVHPTNGRLYVAVAQDNGATPAVRPKWQIIVLEFDQSTLALVRQLPLGAFQSRLGTPSPMYETPEALCGSALSPAGDVVFTFGSYPNPADHGTQGSLGWVSLADTSRKGIQYVQDIVQRSGVRAAAAAAGWTFGDRMKNLQWIPGTQDVLLPAEGGGMLRAGLSSTGMSPRETLPELQGYSLMGWIGSTLYVTKIGNVCTLTSAVLTAAPTFVRAWPTVEYVENGTTRRTMFTGGPRCATGTQLFMAGRDGIWIYPGGTDLGKMDDSMIQRTGEPRWYIQDATGCERPGSLLLWIRQLRSAGGSTTDRKSVV